jgi:hypothetical protein
MLAAVQRLRGCVVPNSLVMGFCALVILFLRVLIKFRQLVGGGMKEEPVRHRY